MAYYSISQMIKMRREALGHSRYEYDVEGPSAMSVYRTEEKNIYVSEKNYRKLTRAMGEEESTRRGVLETNNIEILWLVNEISDSFFCKDYDAVEKLIEKLEEQLDCDVKRNQQYITFIKAKLQYKRDLLDAQSFKEVMKENLSNGILEFDEMLERKWPFREREWNRLLSIAEAVRESKEYEEQKKILERIRGILEKPYMETEYTVAYRMYVGWRMGDALGNIGLHREAIEIEEEILKLGIDNLECHYLPEVYYEIFWNYQEIKKHETLTEKEELRCKECLMRAYYIDKAISKGKQLYKQKIQVYYPEELAGL